MPLIKARERGSRKVTPPSPSYMSNDQFAAYLSNLRDNRLARPGGARPPPSKTPPQVPPSDTNDGGRPPAPRVSLDACSVTVPESSTLHSRTNSESSKFPVAASVTSRYSIASTTRGRDYYPDRPAVDQTAPKPLRPDEVVPTATYMERGQRWMEKEEVVSLRHAMNDMDVKDDDESRLYQAALGEASELVWQHQNGQPPPAVDGPYRYRPHLRKNSYAHARTASAGRYGSEFEPTGLARDIPRSASGSSVSSDGNSSQRSRYSVGSIPEYEVSGADVPPEKPSKVKSYKGIGSGIVAFAHRRRSSMKRNISGEIERPFSGDQIWEEPESPEKRAMGAGNAASREITGAQTRQPLSRVPSLPQNQDAVPAPLKLRSIVDIHRNPPSQSRNGQYTSNTATTRAPLSEDIPNKAGVEIRSDDIRQATSMKLGQRSAKLPTPSAVSNKPGRPIVSFDPDWKPPEEAKPEAPAPRGPVAVPPIPTIVTPDDKRESWGSIPSIVISETPAIPSINVEEAPPSVPMIVTPDDADSGSKPSDRGQSRPLPQPGTSSRRSLPWQRRRAPPPPVVGCRATACCHECGFPIEGRFVALALEGRPERFHPQCFTCFTCGTALEALEISPEPDAARNERLERIRRRAAGEALDEEPGCTAGEDGDERLRFFCHLDWHELFAPRCRHCRTPILGEHVVALGEHWHYGHFFCAECGDPFGEGDTHIEKDGYAWCVGCQTRRTERRAPKCRGCRAAVIGQYVIALGGEWHDECFRCATCNGGFEDGQIFPKEEGEKFVILCTRCRSMELKQ